MKKIIVITLIVFMTCSLAACNYENDTKQRAKNEIEMMGFVVVENMFVKGDNCAYIVYDPNTKVEYIVYRGYRSFSICPYYDENGNIAIYGAE